MKIEINKIKTNSGKDTCFVHARGAFDAKGRFIITTQPLKLTGCDVFYRMHRIISTDGGKSWSEITPCEKLGRKPFEEDMEYCMSDATPLLHKKTGKLLLTGHTVVYKDDNLAPAPRKGCALYSVFDEEKDDFGDNEEIKLPKNDLDIYFSGSGCCQCYELCDGDILVPITYRNYETACDPWNRPSNVAVLRCSFDGRKLVAKEMGNSLSVDAERGLGEPSVIKCGDMFYLCLRNDESGYVTKSCDGLHYEKPVALCFDNGENVGNYNTQQHFIKGGDKLYLVYTRKAGNNDHVFRHRAPLFMAQMDTERMCLIRDTEVIVVPERGARLGNFGCFNVSDNEAYVVASEWMQAPNGGKWDECAAYGSDNSIFVTKITF